MATELYFSEKERIVANMMDGTKKEIFDHRDINVDEVRNVEYYINSENLKTKSDYIIVDTPGFDSGIEQHNKALMQYIDRGTVFILVVDCEKGTISESGLNFLYEVSQYSGKIAIIINKCDKKIPTDIKMIEEHIEEVVYSFMGEKYPITCTSIFDEDIEEKLKNVINGFDAQTLFDEEIGGETKKIGLNTITSLEILEKEQQCNTNDLDKEIAKREEAKKKLNEQLKRQKIEVSNKLRVEVKDRILENIASQLMCNAQTLAEAFEGGTEVFRTRVIEIVRPIMINEMEEYANLASDNILKGIKIDSSNVTTDLDQIIPIVQNIKDKISTIHNDKSLKGKFKLPKVKLGKSSGAGKELFKNLTSIIAVTTNVVAPYIEIIIYFLPEIIDVLKGITGSSREQEIIETIQRKTIPQIVSKMREELDNPLSEMEEAMLENIQNSIDELINVENAALEVAKSKKMNKKAEYAKFIKNIQEDILSLKKWVK